MRLPMTVRTQPHPRHPRHPAASRPARRPQRAAHWAALLALPALAAQAQTTAPQQVEVVGVAPLPGLELPREQVAANVQSARAIDLERSQTRHVGEFLQQRLASVHVNELQGNGYQPDLNYRGFSASPLLGTAQGLSLYLDGVRLNQPFGDVVSWDLVPSTAIASLSLMPGSNPLFGLNTLGGALSLQTKTGKSHPGSAVTLGAGSHGAATLGFEWGGSRDDGTHGYLTGLHRQDDGWRVNSRSRIDQLFGKLGGRLRGHEFTLTLAAAESRLNGNGLQEFRLLEADRRSVYSQPDSTHNRSLLLNLAVARELGAHGRVTANLHARRLKTHTLNGDVNDDALDQSVYHPNATERGALAAAGFSGFPASGENAGNTPFPKWRCIAQALLRDEPAEKCNGLINQSDSTQNQWGLSLQFASDAPLAGLANRFVAGLAFEASRVHFTQGSELGYLNPDHSITGVGAFGDGVSGGDVDGEPYDTRVDLSARSRTASLYASNTVALGPRTHLTLAGRYNRSTVRNRDAITPGGGSGSLDGDHRFSRFNPALGLSFAATPTLGLYGSVNQGSRTPSAIELGCADPESPCKLPNAMAGDPPLRQVVTTTVEAGLRGRAGAATQWNLAWFRADNRDDILFVADNAAGFGYFKNFGKTRRQGLEMSLSTRLDGVQLNASYTWLEASFQSHEALNGAGNSHNEQAEAGFPGVDGAIDIAPGDRIPLIPRHLFKLSADWAFAATASLGLDLNAVGGAYARGNENNAHLADGRYYLGAGRSAGYAVVALRGEWKPLPRLTLSAKVNNLFDRRYDTAAQLGATAFDAQGRFVARPFPANANGERPLVGSTFYAPGAPRSISLSARYEF